MGNQQDLTASLFAHRLTSITDSLGNRIGEAVTDPNGALTRRISRIHDTLNRLTHVIGAVQ